MPVANNELKFYKPKVVSDAGTNGGRMSANEIITNTLQNTFGHVFSAERTAGSTKYRKIFCRVDNDSDLSLMAPLLRFFAPTDGDDYCCFFMGTATDTQADIVGTERKYGVGTLNTTVSAGGSTLIIDVQNAAHATGNDAIFADGDEIIITDKATYDAATGNQEQHTISGAPSVSGTEVTITIAGTLANGYTAGTGTKIMSCKDPSTVTTSYDNWAETCAGSGTYDESSYPPVLDNLGTQEQTVTLTFTDATNFTATSDDGDITLGSGTTGSDFAPTNPDFSSKPYFTLEAAGWAGTWAAGDTVVFSTHAATLAVWEERVVPASCSSLSGNKLTLVWSGESA